MGKPKRTLQLALRSQKVAKLREMILGGETSRQKMAAALDVTEMTISNYVKLIRKGFGNTPNTEEKIESLRNICSEQFSHVLQKFLTAYEISKSQEVETTTVMKEEKCESCKGTGIKLGTEKEWCLTCDGDCTVKMEVVTQRQKGKAGDPSYLEGARKCIADKAKLLGLYVERKGVDESPPGGNHLHFYNENNPFAGASREAIVEAMSAMARLKRESQQRTIEVDGYNKEEDKPESEGEEE